MAYIVDGNNVMGQTPGWHRDKSKARLGLLEQLAAFTHSRKARITVVFDGAPDHYVPEGAAYHGVKVLYAKKGSDADRRIEELVESARDRRGLIVVTSDRQLAHEVRSLGATVMRSGEFRRLMEETSARRPPAKDKEQIDLGDTNEWLRYFGALPEDE